jgi:mono/diheme cytochrome c family protein
MFKTSQRFGVAGVATAGAVVLMLGISGCKKSPDPDISPESTFDVAFLEDGKQITETQCLVCHSVDSSKEGPRSDAPPLSTVLAKYNPNMLADDFREHVHVGHPDMPDFDFNVKQTEGLLAYLSSIQEE